jgi:hypothetical protein
VRLLGRGVAKKGKRRSRAPQEIGVAHLSGRHLHTRSEVTTAARQSTLPCVLGTRDGMRCRSQEFAKSGGSITVRHSRVRPTIRQAQNGLSHPREPMTACTEQTKRTYGDDHEKGTHFGACRPVGPKRNSDVGQRGVW